MAVDVERVVADLESGRLRPEDAVAVLTEAMEEARGFVDLGFARADTTRARR